MIENFAKWFYARLNEPSSYAGIAVFWRGINAIAANHDDVTGYVAVIGGTMAFVLGEKVPSIPPIK